VVFEQPTADALFHALVRAVELFRDRPAWLAVQQRGMRGEFGWTQAAAQYEQLYEGKMYGV
jgi:starch synthase